MNALNLTALGPKQRKTARWVIEKFANEVTAGNVAAVDRYSRLTDEWTIRHALTRRTFRMLMRDALYALDRAQSERKAV